MARKIEFGKPSLISDIKEFLTQMIWLFTFIALVSIIEKL
jgi:hypothetical protein